jgi:malonyl-CoA O-methyltransferase
VTTNRGAPFELDRHQIRRAFERASSAYDRSAVLQARVRDELLARLDYTSLEPGMILDAGCGTGHASRQLKRRYSGARVIALDIAVGMLRVAARQQHWWRKFDRVCGDALALPLAAASVDLVFSSLMLQWCGDLDAALAELRRVLKPRGLLTFATFGPDTLRELRDAWARADSRTHVNRFLDMHDIGDALVRAGLGEPVLDVERYTLTYDDVHALMRDLKAIGAHNVTTGRPPGLTGRGRLAAMKAGYEAHRSGGKLPATYEVVYGQAWAPTRAPGASRESIVPVSAIGRRRPQ